MRNDLVCAEKACCLPSSTAPLWQKQMDIVLLLLGHKRMVAPFVNFNVSPKRLLLQSEPRLLETRLTKHRAVDVCLHTAFLQRSVSLLLCGI